MARSVALSTIISRAQVHADMRNSGFMSPATALLMLNDVYPRLYDELVASNGNYYATSDTFTVSSAETAYDLPDDFYKILSIEFSVDGSTYYPLSPFNEGEHSSGFSTGILGGTIRIRYVPAPEVFTAISQTVDGVAGWDRMLSLLLAIDMLDAEESNTDRVYRKYQEELSRIQSMAPNRDIGMPATVRDTSLQPYAANYDWLRYRLYGDTIEFVSWEYLGV